MKEKIKVRYIGKYKWLLEEDYLHPLGYKCVPIVTEYIILINGVLEIREGYAWNGANFVRDTETNRRASLVHDALYQLMNLGLLPKSFRKIADKEYLKAFREDCAEKYKDRPRLLRLCWFRSGYQYYGLKKFGYFWARKKKRAA